MAFMQAEMFRTYTIASRQGARASEAAERERETLTPYSGSAAMSAAVSSSCLRAALELTSCAFSTSTFIRATGSFITALGVGT